MDTCLPAGREQLKFKKVKNALVAQWIERRRPKAGVVGSIPAKRTSKEFASSCGSPRFARRLNCKEF